MKTEKFLTSDIKCDIVSLSMCMNSWTVLSKCIIHF